MRLRFRRLSSILAGLSDRFRQILRLCRQQFKASIPSVGWKAGFLTPRYKYVLIQDGTSSLAILHS